MPLLGAPPREQDDLNLSRRIEQDKPALAPIPNPHDFPCQDCHVQTGEEGKVVILTTGDDSVKLCLECHPDSNLHPVGVPAANSPEGASQVWLPLGKGRAQGQIVCLTCHYVHAPGYRRHILRGDTELDSQRSGTLCQACHGDQLTLKSPHVKGKGTCTFCHSSPPREGQSAKGTVNASVQLACNFCHGALDDGHYLSLNPFSDPCVTWRPGGRFGIPLLDGKFTCVSCHDPHGVREAGGRDTHLLRPVYLKLASLSHKIRPHWRDALCVSCHQAEPRKGEPALREGGDINALCNGCHESRYARRDLHPVGVAPDGRVRIPEGWPLAGGKLTCETCHDSSLQEAGERMAAVRKKNPNFLRGGYKSRNEFCFRCHLTQHYAGLNPHLQTGPNGKVIEQSCLFCHSSLPDQKVAGIANLFRPGQDLDEYCTWCHAEGYQEGHPTATHLVEPSEALLAAMESAPQRIGVEFPLYDGRLVCASCHNPHEAGVLDSNRGAGSGAGKKMRLRLNAGREMCVGCHANR